MGQLEIPIFVETGKRWTFAGAVEWPGWCRRGKDESLAKAAMLEAGHRYAGVLASSDLDFAAPDDVEAFHIMERVKGNSTTDFGAPDASLSSDADQVGEAAQARFRSILHACWQAFDQAVQAAEGRELRKGPRGGGRDLVKIIGHLIDGDASYLGRIGWKVPGIDDLDRPAQLAAMRQSILDGMAASAGGELPMKGPRGGLRWPARRFVRRAVWHVLDHTWEIEDRLE
jgi:hypothetical protein